MERTAALLRVGLVLALCCGDTVARYVPSYVVPLEGVGSPLQQLLLQIGVSSPAVDVSCVADTGFGYIMLPSPDACPAASAPLYSRTASATAGFGTFLPKNDWDEEMPVDAGGACRKTLLFCGNGSSIATCGFKDVEGAEAQAYSGVTVTDGLAFGAGYTGFGTWQEIAINAVLGSVDLAADPPALCAPPAAARCGLNWGPSSLHTQLRQLGPAGADRGVGLCVNGPGQQQQPGSFLVLGGSIPGAATLQLAESSLLPGSNASNTDLFGRWVELQAVGFGAQEEDLGDMQAEWQEGGASALLDTGTPALVLPAAVVDAYAAAVQEAVAASPGLTLTSVSPLAVSGPSLEAVAAAFPDIQLHFLGNNATVEVNSESFTAVDSVSSGDVTLTAAALVAAQPGQRIMLGLPLFAGRFTWLGDEKAVFSQLLGPEGCTADMTGGAPLGPDPSPAGASGNGAGASSLSMLPGALLAAAVAACWLVYH
ncbi:hypothetical protein D9Q98_004572 [Chlorella vulgaris]|uniref:Peptidase A1 domain-containing protein n=1 Tax=Chlorella vulgaris TaxID=3077 RepID=A0A9D4YXE9_CHLVU|nr:hypothetical protein D9Q98_004572 [Chlorella vulgaris]